MGDHAPPYAGPVEALTLDEVAVRLRMTRQWVENNYSGPVLKLGRNKLISAKHLDAWLDEQAGLRPLSGAPKKKGRPVEV